MAGTVTGTGSTTEGLLATGVAECSDVECAGEAGTSTRGYDVVLSPEVDEGTLMTGYRVE